MRIGIHQIYYDRAQLPELEPAFIPYDNTANPNREWAEYHVFETEFRKGTHKNFDYTGFVSWKFRQKSRVSGDRFIEFMKSNPGADLYFINPFPMEELLFKNVWLQGEFYHPGILEFSQEILRRAGYDLDLQSWQQPRETFAFCNYWAGNEKFWHGYMEFTGKIADILRIGLSDSESSFLHSLASRTNNFSYIAFIMERMFSVFIHLWNPIAIRYVPSPVQLATRYPGVKGVLFGLLKKRGYLYSLWRFLALTARRNREP